ncbi:hypothetical protein KA005_80800, partial [bacterium]|nr:hypothetical protein [bacterium]
IIGIFVMMLLIGITVLPVVEAIKSNEIHNVYGKILISTINDPPTYFDLRNVNGDNYVTSVRYQFGGSCWCHATMAAIESNLLMTETWVSSEGREEPNLAEYHLEWWNGFNQHNNDDTDPPTGGGLSTHLGGDYRVAAAYLSRGEGPLHDEDAQSWNTPPPRYNLTDLQGRRYYVNDIEWFVAGSDLSNIDTIKYRIMEEGAISTCMYYGGPDDDFTFYQPPEDEKDPHHAIAIIGWDDNKNTQAPNPGAWLCKDSYGTDNYCLDGYFWISYYDKHCGQHPEMGAVSFKNVEYLRYDNIYYHDYHGWRDTKTDCTAAFNAFTAESDEILKAVSFFTAVDNVDYTIKIYDRFESDNLDGELSVESGTIYFTGFHTIDLNLPVELMADDDFYIYLELSAGGYAYDRTSEVPVLLGGTDAGIIVESTANPGESYYLTESVTWLDLYEFNNTANFCIKGLSVSTIPIPIKPSKPSGLTTGKVNTDYTYSLIVNEPGAGSLYYKWDWGDGTESEWFGQYDHGEEVSLSHAWSEKGIYAIKVKAKNIGDHESEWSDPLMVGIPTKNQGIDQKQWIPNGGWGGGGGYALAQSFIPTVDTFSKISLFLEKSGSPHGVKISIRCDLYEFCLTYAFLPGDEISDQIPRWCDIDFPEIEVTPGVTYYIVFEQDGGDRDNMIFWILGDNNPYSDGCAWSNSGGPTSSWTELDPSEYPNPDFCFRTYHVKPKYKSLFQLSTDIERLLQRFPSLERLLN